MPRYDAGRSVAAHARVTRYILVSDVFRVFMYGVYPFVLKSVALNRAKDIQSTSLRFLVLAMNGLCQIFGV